MKNEKCKMKNEKSITRTRNENEYEKLFGSGFCRVRRKRKRKSKRKSMRKSMSKRKSKSKMG